MGYTHHWRNAEKIDYEVWQSICADVRTLALNCEGARVGYEPNRLFIWGDCETFFLSRKPGRGFCKTRLLPYDKLVCATLAIAKERHAKLRVMSDGFLGDDGGAWRRAMKWASHELHRKIPDPGPIVPLFTRLKWQVQDVPRKVRFWWWIDLPLLWNRLARRHDAGEL